jgi:hypothetical protein
LPKEEDSWKSIMTVVNKPNRWLNLCEGLALAILWFAVVFASLAIHQLDLANAHSICGPWGCGPTNGALLGMHVGWLAVIWPPLLYLPWRFSWNKMVCRRLGCVFASVGCVGLLGITAWQWMVWLPQAGEFSRSFIWQRCGFAIATAVDWPMVQSLGIGVFLLVPPLGNTKKQSFKPTPLDR